MKSGETRLLPELLQTHDVRGAEPGGPLSQDGREGLGEVARRDALEVERRDQSVDLRAASPVARQNGVDNTSFTPHLTFSNTASLILC